MPYQNQVVAPDVVGNFFAGRQAAQQDAVQGLQMQRAQRLNALAGNPAATPEQYIRAGDAQTGSALAGEQQRAQVDKMQAVQQLAAIAQKGLGIKDPVQRRGFIQQAVQAYGPAFQALGADPQKGLAELATLPDDQLEQRLTQVAQFGAPQKPIEVGAGGALAVADPQNPGKYISAFTAPPKPDAVPSAIQEYQFAKQQGYKGTFQQYQLQMKQAGAQQINLPSGYRWNPDGSMAPIPGGPADPSSKNKPPTEADKKNAVLFSSMNNAEQQIADIEKAAGGKATDTGSVLNQALGSNALTRPLQSDAFRKYESAALRWSANLLYLKSGATATPEEVQSTRKQFFPQPGDGPEVLKQKAQARQQEVEAIRQNMVPGATTAPPSSPSDMSVLTATGPNGQKLYLRGGQWVPQ